MSEKATCKTGGNICKLFEQTFLQRHTNGPEANKMK